MAERQTRRRPPRAPHRPRDTLTSKHTSAFFSTSERSETHYFTRGFRVPSPTPSEEAQIRSLEEQLAGLSVPSSTEQPVNERTVEPLFEPTKTVRRTDRPSSGDSKLLSLNTQASPPFQIVHRQSVAFNFIPNALGKDGAQTNMVVEREPPKTAQSPQKPSQPTLGSVKQPEFGKASPLQNRLLPRDVFNIPKANHQRPEHHRPVSPAQSIQQQQHHNGQTHPFRDPFQQKPTAPTTSVPGKDPDVVEIPRPQQATPWPNAIPTQQPFFLSVQNNRGFVPVNPFGQPVNVNYVDLTKTQNGFNPDAALFDDKFGSADPYTYVDAGKATENIKALLEGAFDEEDGKPRTRGRKKKAEAEVANLANKMKSLDVKNQANYDDAHEEPDEEQEEDGTVEGLNVKLLPHQMDGVEWMRDKESSVKKKNGVLPKGGILADDMGLGKTIQSISLMLEHPRPPKTASTDIDKKAIPNFVDKGTLVVAPLALIKQWEGEIKNRVSDSHRLRVCIHHGPQRTKRYEDLRKYDVVITTYQILVSEHGGSSERDDGPKVGCFGLHWYRVILDEAHTIKNRNAKATQACYALRAEYRWCLTGTPMQNNLDELQSLIRFLKIKPYNDLSIWKDQITRPLANGRGGIAMRRLQYYLKAFMKRRTKDVLKQEGALNLGGKASTAGSIQSGFKITARRIESVEADFSPEERKFYERLEQRTDKSLEQMMGGEKMNYASALVLLLRLRQACNHPRLVGGNLANDRDALTTGQGGGTQTPRKSKVVEKEIDDLADLLGGVSVETKKCDICQLELERAEAAAGSTRCAECEDNLQEQAHTNRKKKKKEASKVSKQPASKHGDGDKHQARALRNRKVVLDDSDDEEDGDWLVAESQRQSLRFGKAGGTDDEDAEGGGESLVSEDTFTEDESAEGSNQRQKAISLDTSDDEEEDYVSDNESSSEAEADTDNDDASFSSSDSISPTSSAKIKQLLRILHRESSQHKFIVFSQFTSMLDLIEPFLRKENLTFTRYDGSMRNDLREASLERLRNDTRTRILLCSLKCGSLGLNLTAASRVVILEPFWNPFVEEQAIDRVHRLNQTLDVTIYKLTVPNTVEARILELQNKKRELAKQAIEGGKAGAGKLSMKDILNLFRRDAEHEHHDDGVVGSLGSKGRLLGGTSKRDGDAGGVTAARVVGKAAGPRMDEGVYGRRW
ncbi:MAG: hypothetical protein Q9201_005022 [Fulgogasparrea decipioides]